MNQGKKYSLILVMLASCMFFTTCRKDEFDAPPSGGQDPNLVVNMTIKGLKDMYRDTIITDGAIVKIKNDWVIAGTVIADDKSGNFYKTVVIDDGTAGIAIRIDRSDYYTRFPIGRRVFVRLIDLVIGDYANLIQIGGYVDNSVPNQPAVAPIPNSLIDKYVLPGVNSLPVIPQVVTINDLAADPDAYQNRLVRIDSVEFIPSDTGETYADAANLVSMNRTLKDCGTGTIIMRNSGYALFAAKPLPNLRGNVTSVFSVFNSDMQLLIRDTYDVDMTGPRCDGSTGNLVLVSIATVRGYFTGTTTTVPPDKKIVGIVISDGANGNIDPKNMAIQDTSGSGIVVRFDTNHTFAMGAKVQVSIGSQELSEFAGLLELNNVPLSAAVQIGTGTITPAIQTISAINTNFEQWESTLVTVQNSNISGTGPTYSGSRTLTDASGNMTLYTRSQATFATQNYPTGTVSVTGVLIPFNATKQITIRNTADVQ